MINEDSILIIDDEVQIRRLLEITLSANGYKISEASSGATMPAISGNTS